MKADCMGDEIRTDADSQEKRHIGNVQAADQGETDEPKRTSGQDGYDSE